MAALIAFLTTRLGKLLGSIALVATTILAIFQMGRKSKEKDTELEDLNEYVETKKRIEHVEATTDRDDAVERLRDNGWLR